MPDVVLQSYMDGEDLGVEGEAQMSLHSLNKALDFLNGLPFIFNKHRHIHGLNAWDDADHFDTSSTVYNEKNLVPNALHWHQLSGIHAVLRKLFTETSSPDNPLGILLADEVGLGKTALAISIIAFFSHVHWLIKKTKALPPIISEFIINYFTYYVYSLPIFIRD